METPHSNFYERIGHHQAGLLSVRLVGHRQKRPRKPKVSWWEERDHHPGGYWEAMTKPAESEKNRARWLWKNVLDMFKDTWPWLPTAASQSFSKMDIFRFSSLALEMNSRCFKRYPSMGFGHQADIPSHSYHPAFPLHLTSEGLENV